MEIGAVRCALPDVVRMDVEPVCAYAKASCAHVEALQPDLQMCSATLQRAVLAGLESRSCFVYLDDILIASRTFDEHLEHLKHLKEVLERLRAAGLRLKPKKCLFLREEVPYLGHVISASGIKPDPSKTAEVKAFPVPCDVMAVHQFLGLASYYQWFVPGFASIAALLRALTKKNTPFQWTLDWSGCFWPSERSTCDCTCLGFSKIWS